MSVGLPTNILVASPCVLLTFGFVQKLILISNGFVNSYETRASFMSDCLISPYFTNIPVASPCVLLTFGSVQKLLLISDGFFLIPMRREPPYV